MKLSWKIMYYKNKHDNLILSDIDEMRKIASPQNDPGKLLYLYKTFISRHLHYIYIIFRWKKQSINHRNVSRAQYLCHYGLA